MLRRNAMFLISQKERGEGMGMIRKIEEGAISNTPPKNEK